MNFPRQTWKWAGAIALATGCADDGTGSGSGGSSGGPATVGGSSGGEATGGSSGGGVTTGEQPTTGNPTTATSDASATTTTGTTGSVLTDSSGDASGSSGGGTTGGGPCGGCPPDFICKYDQCLPNLGKCMTYDDCPGDSYCDQDGDCIPYDVPPGVINDPNCKKEDIPQGVTPEVQCEWTAPKDPNDPTKASTMIYTTPIVADLNLDKDPDKLQPSIIVTTFATINGSRIGTARVFDGRTCEEQMRLGGADAPDFSNRPSYAVPWAVADLNGDVPMGGHPELVSYQLSSNNQADPVRLYALEIDSSGMTPKLVRKWYGRDCANGDKILTFGNGTMLEGPVLNDLNDDGLPEIVVGEQVFDGNGCLLTTWNASTATTTNYVADVDLDGEMDLIAPARVAGWDSKTTEWVNKPWFVKNANQLAGHVGVADLGAYSAVPGVDPAKQPEVVVLSYPNLKGQIRFQTLDGKIVWGPIPLYRTGNPAEDRGGPITISDFDGDGQVEFASAGATQYVVYDPDCVAALMGKSPPERPGGTCVRAPDQVKKNLPDGVLWAQPSQDLSSNITGSSIFDFDADQPGCDRLGRDGRGDVLASPELLRLREARAGPCSWVTSRAAPRPRATLSMA